MDATSSTWMLVHSTLGERKLDYYALQNSFASRLNIGEHLMLRKSHGTAADLLDDSPPLRRNAPTALCAPPVYVKPEATPFLYKTHDGDESDDGDDFAEHEYGFGEYDYRHPGTNWDSLHSIQTARCQGKFLQGRFLSFLQGGTQGTQGEEDASPCARGEPEAPQVEVERRMRQDTAYIHEMQYAVHLVYMLDEIYTRCNMRCISCIC